MTRARTAVPAECAGTSELSKDDISGDLEHARRPAKQGAADLNAPRIPPGLFWGLGGLEAKWLRGSETQRYLPSPLLKSMTKVMQDQRSTGLEGLVVAAETDTESKR